MRVLVTGASGFLGRRLIDALLTGSPGLQPVSRIVAADLIACPIGDERLDARVGSITDPAFVGSIVRDVDAVYHLAAVLSGESEADFDKGMRVNVDGTRTLLEACRGLVRPPRFVFASTIAVFGGVLPAVVPEDLVPRPQSSYGAAKVIGETLAAEYSRRGFVRAVIARLPTIAVRPGAPNSAMSSFVSGIVREPLAGLDAVCPVPLDTPIWISSPDVVTANLVHAAVVSPDRLSAPPTVNLPGLSVTPGQMLDALERVAGPAARRRVRLQIDPLITRVVGGWPGAFDISRALRLGFRADPDISAVVHQAMREPAG